MKILAYLCLFLLSTSVFASPLDQKLKTYIRKFNLAPLTPPSERNLPLARLGQQLFMSRLISGNKNISCMDCHHPGLMTIDNLPLALGEGAKGFQTDSTLRTQESAKVIARNSPALFNLHAVNVMFWDGRVSFNPLTKTFYTPSPFTQDIIITLKSALAAQSIFPLVDHAEMRGQPGSNPIANASTDLEAWNLIVERILEVPSLRAGFDEAFPGQKINIGHVGEALAEFQGKQFFFADTPYDRFLKGDVTYLSDLQKKGMDVFFDKARCGNCHNGEHLSSFGFQSVGVPQIGPGKENGDDFGRHQWDKRASKYSFRVAPLRNVGLSAPYMHDGVYKDLSAVVEHYNNVGFRLTNFRPDTGWDRNYVERLKDHDYRTNNLRISSLSPELVPMLGLTGLEKEALIEFLKVGLTDIKLMDRLPQ